MSEPTHVYNSNPPTATLVSGLADSAVLGTIAPPTGYQLESLIGEGGMGFVYRAREVAMSRDVAVKILHSRYSAESVIGQRFVEEARITGQLQHPGIPPVHQVGTLPDGRPFLAMKLIKGDTLAELLDKRKDPGTDRGRYVAIFEQVAQAVGYAHSHSVIHRDLKPANVMVGSFGEVQVMDWGLAKVLGAGQTAETSVDDATLRTEIRSLRENAEATQAGSLLGTPAFMPPEQAIGAVDQVTERSDVFGLGAILCVILTGEPPFVSGNAETTRLLAARGKLDGAFTRLDGCGAEPELIALTKRCLAPEPADRPRDAGEVAEAISSLRADAERRARQAEMERARSEVKSAEERKRRRVQRALMMAVLTLVAVAGVAAWWIESVRADRRAEQLTREAELKARAAESLSRQLLTERDVIAALNEVQVLREEGWKQAGDTPRWALTLAVARSSFKRAEALLKSGVATAGVSARVDSAGKDLAQDDRDLSLLAELDRIEEENDLRFLMPVVFNGRQADKYGRAFGSYGIDLVGMPTVDAVSWLKGHRFRDRLTTALHNWELARPVMDGVSAAYDMTLVQPMLVLPSLTGEAVVQGNLQRPSIRDRLIAILTAVADEPFSREWYSALARKDNTAIRNLLSRPEFKRLSSRELSSLVDGLVNSHIANIRRDLFSEILRVSYERFPGEYWVNFRLGTHGGLDERSNGDSSRRQLESIRYLSAALAARPHSSVAHVALGMALLDENKDDPTGIHLLRKAVALDPASPWPHIFLGIRSTESGDWQETFKAFREAVRIDPDIGFLMIYSTQHLIGANQKAPPPDDFARFENELIAIQPTHAMGYMMRAATHYKNGDFRLALEDFRRAKPLFTPDNPLKQIGISELKQLEGMALWEPKLPTIQRGELKPATGAEYLELAQYCAGFEKKYFLATQFASEALRIDTNLYGQWIRLPQFVCWPIKAANGEGIDAMTLSETERAKLRKKALAWLREAGDRTHKVNKDLSMYFADLCRSEAGLASVRDQVALAKLPPDERAEWKRFWDELPQKDKKLDTAPAPRQVKN